MSTLFCILWMYGSLNVRDNDTYFFFFEIADTGLNLLDKDVSILIILFWCRQMKCILTHLWFKHLCYCKNFWNIVINYLEYKFNLKNRKFEIKLKSNLFIELRKNTVKNLTHASVHKLNPFQYYLHEPSFCWEVWYEL